jgi:hypothetical protein
MVFVELIKKAEKMKTTIYIVRAKIYRDTFTCGMFPTMKQAQAYAAKARLREDYDTVWCDAQDIKPL